MSENERFHLISSLSLAISKQWTTASTSCYWKHKAPNKLELKIVKFYACNSSEWQSNWTKAAIILRIIDMIILHENGDFYVLEVLMKIFNGLAHESGIYRAKEARLLKKYIKKSTEKLHSLHKMLSQFYFVRISFCSIDQIAQFKKYCLFILLR